MKIFFIGILLFIAMPVFAFEYRGEGDFTDRGMSTAFNRYRLVLPPVNLCETGNYSFYIGELPAEGMSLEMEYVYPKGLSEEDAVRLRGLMSREIIIKMTLEDLEKKTILYKYEGKLYESGHDESGKYWERGIPGYVNDLYKKIEFRVDVDFYSGFFGNIIVQRSCTSRLLRP